MRILVIHPDDDEGRVFVAHLKRIGCQVDIQWPAPAILEEYTDVVLFLLGPQKDPNTASWMSSADDITRIAIISFETPEILSELKRLNVHGVLTKPIRLFGVLAALTTAVGVARHELTLRNRVRSLDNTLKSRRLVEQAVAVLSESRGIGEKEAYKRLRDKSQNSQTSIGEVAQAILAAHDV
ncbi:MAG: ANTAR domain-containing protein [Pseudomonadota bacterium]